MTWLDYPLERVPLQDCLTKHSETLVLLATVDSHLRIFLEQADTNLYGEGCEGAATSQKPNSGR